MIGTSIENYPFDVQVNLLVYLFSQRWLVQFADILIAPSDYSKAKVVLTTESWNQRLGEVKKDDGWMADDKSKSTLWYKYYNGDAEWNMLAFKLWII